MVLVQKIGIGISVQLLGALLTFAGYQSSAGCFDLANCAQQSSVAITTIRISMGLIPSLLVALGLLTMRDWFSLKPKYSRETT